jgi:Fe-S cluster assembly protein SufD
MAKVSAIHTIARERVEQLASQGAEPGWLKGRRLSAWESYLSMPMPTMRDELWKKTDISALELSALKTVDTGKVGTDRIEPGWFSNYAKHFGRQAGFLYQRAEAPGYVELKPEWAAKGVILTDIRTALANHADLLRPFLDRQEQPTDDGKFSLMNKALFNCGTLLYVPKNLEIDEPFISGLSVSSSGAIFPRLIVIAEAHSKFSILQVFDSTQGTADGAEPSLVAGLTEVYVADGANVSYVELQEYSGNLYNITRTHTEVQRDATFRSLTVALGGKQTKSDLATLLQEQGASSSVMGLVLGTDSEHYNFNTIQEHNAPDTTSDINFRVALKDSAASIYQGTVKVAKIAQRTNAFQSNKNLLLGAEAHADSIPRLEILADDVKCSHGATVGPVDREQIFYLMSRGMTAEQSEELIVLGFFRQVLEQFGLPAAVDWLGDVVGRRIYGKESHCDD